MRYLFYHGRISPEGVRNVETLVIAAHKEGDKEIALCLASEGGDVNAGIGLFNFFKMMPVTLHTHAAGPCASIAVTILLAGKHRTADPLSVFSIHQASFAEGPLIGQRSPNTDLIAQPFKDVLDWTDEEVATRFGTAEHRFSPQEALAMGVIEEIKTPTIGAEDQITPVRIP